MKGKKAVPGKAKGHSAKTAPPEGSSFTPEDWADIEAHTAAEAAKAVAAAKRAGQKLTGAQITEIFRNTPAMEEGLRLARTADNRLSRDLVSVEIKVPRSAIELLQFLDRDRAKNR
jgi:hypothetical protein